MTGWRAVPAKQRRAFRRRNHFARDLYTPKYGPRGKESKKKHLIDEIEEHEMDVEAASAHDEYDLHKDLGLTSKE